MCFERGGFKYVQYFIVPFRPPPSSFVVSLMSFKNDQTPINFLPV